MARLFLIFTVIPVIEIYLMIKAGSLIGPLPTVALLLLISMAGAWLVRHQGFGLLRRIQAELAAGRLPAGELLDSALVLVGGVLLLTPGFFTDFLGFFFLIPVTRTLIKRFAVFWIQQRLTRGVITIRGYRR